MSNTVFTGVGTAVITPMNADGSINFGEFARVLDYQVEHGADAVVVCGTTGEASTMPDDEHIECIRFAVEKIAKRIPVIAGTGSNDTVHAIRLSKPTRCFRLPPTTTKLRSAVWQSTFWRLRTALICRLSCTTFRQERESAFQSTATARWQSTPTSLRQRKRAGI